MCIHSRSNYSKQTRESNFNRKSRDECRALLIAEASTRWMRTSAKRGLQFTSPALLPKPMAERVYQKIVLQVTLTLFLRSVYNVLPRRKKNNSASREKEHGC